MKNFNLKWITNAIFFTAVLVLLFVPSAKAYLMQGLMAVGLFKPDTTAAEVPATSNLAGIRFKNMEGKEVDLGDLKGRVVFINFWATWCPPCLAEMPSVNKLYEQFKDNEKVVFLLVDADRDFHKASAYMKKKNYDMPVYAAASNVPEAIFKGALPTTVVFDQAGRLSYRGEGAANYADPKFIAFITKLLAL